VVHAWAVPGDVEPARLRSNTFSMEWPPRSGKQQEFPEIDRVEWFAIDEALRRILPGQAGFLRELASLV
jgi:predicted NUDIX family NTP pyrophosphohydrolase